MDSATPKQILTTWFIRIIPAKRVIFSVLILDGNRKIVAKSNAGNHKLIGKP